MKKKIFLDGPRAPRSTIKKKTVGALGTRMSASGVVNSISEKEKENTRENFFRDASE